jgi:hypothetical protein
MNEETRRFFASERRLTMLLVGHWQEARDGRRCPRASDFTALVPNELLADCFTYHPPAVPPAEGERGRLCDIGAALARVSGVPAGDIEMDDVPANSLLGVAIKSLDRTLQDGIPVLDDGAFEDRSGVIQLYRATLLPLENEAGEVALVIGGVRCKAS